ncbi:MAG: mechanosensitive ion channel family protein, partial [Bacteroidetes bacterium]
YAILILGLINAFAIMGINTASLIASLGIAGLTIGFAARDALSNMISGLFIFWDRPFVIGDLIEVGDKYGQVERITLRSTRVVTPDGKMLAIPNNEIVNKTVASYTNFPHLRIEVEVTVATHEDLGRARRLLLDLVRDDPEVMQDPPPRVVVKALNDYNVALALQVWIDDERRHIEKRFALREAVFETFTRAGVDMPFETLSLTPIEVRTARSA